MTLHQLDAKTYQKYNISQRTIAHEIWDKIPLRGNEHLLDVGCGDGLLTFQMAEDLPSGQITGIDPSSSMIDAARRHHVHNLHFEKRGAHDIDEVEAYDIITAFSCLHYIPKVDQALEKIFRALKPNGRFFALTYTTDDGMGKLQTEMFNSPRWQPLVRPEGLNLISTAEHRKLLENLPWNFTYLEESRKALVDESGLRRNLEVFAPLMLDCSEEEQYEFVDALIERLRRPGEPFQAPYVTLKIFAKRGLGIPRLHADNGHNNELCGKTG